MSRCRNNDFFAMIGCINPVCIFGCVEAKRRDERDLKALELLARIKTADIPHPATERLKACPFCQAELKFLPTGTRMDGEDIGWLSHPPNDCVYNLHGFAGFTGDKTELFEKWNRRPASEDTAAAPEGMNEFLKELNATLCNARQLIGGWKCTTPENEWSEFDEMVSQQMGVIHAKADKLLTAAAPVPGKTAEEWATILDKDCFKNGFYSGIDIEIVERIQADAIASVKPPGSP